MSSVALMGLVKIELPDRTIRFSEGGFITISGDGTYESEDEVFGTIGAVETMEEGLGDTIPAFTMVLLPPNITAPVELSQPGSQTARATFSVVEYDPETGDVIQLDALFNGQIDQTTYTFAIGEGKGVKRFTMSIVAMIEKFFERNIGNTQNPERHKFVWSGETGQDNATGLTKPVAWGAQNLSSGGTAQIGAGGGGGGGGGRGFNQVVNP